MKTLSTSFLICMTCFDNSTLDPLERVRSAKIHIEDKCRGDIEKWLEDHSHGIGTQAIHLWRELRINDFTDCEQVMKEAFPVAQ